MNHAKTNPLVKVASALLLALVLLVFYILWTHSKNYSDWLIIYGFAFLVSLFFTNPQKFPAVTSKKVIYSVFYIFYLFISIVKSNFDVARRVIQPKIPINPGIVRVKTKLKSPVGRMILANSITLTPGTLSVDVKDDYYYIHWIDVTDIDEQKATQKIVSGFEKYLEVIFG
ncbi:MAG TPA: Na+/H+ antiporter subunit E [Caldithrix abyssi]|uniref:Na+/H+ antiporter subunit E n=1 Tax=Caldithrix abyssi TaxID=187145 RepID=A0A7V5LI94_CALAY|nr:Na+/H+ antiporter subunit E [Caldithrix abyssi]